MHAYGIGQGRHEFGKKDQTEKKNTGRDANCYRM